MKYELYRDKNGEAHIRIVGMGETRPLPLYTAEVNHSPSGFEWGYNGSGPAQAAYAILRHALDDKERARKLYQRFKDRYIAILAQKDTLKDEVCHTISIESVFAAAHIVEES